MRRLTVRAAFAAIPVGLCLSLELAAKLFTVYGLGIDQINYKRFYLDNPDYDVVMWSKKYEAHPYVGHIRPEKLRQLEQFRDDRDSSDYVIAILGGSVADDFADYVNDNPDYFEKLRPLIPTAGDRRIQILNLASGGYKQPQQFFMASYKLRQADMTINIEGFNEMAITDLYPVYPTDFPATTLRLFSREEGLNMFKLLAESLTLAYGILHQVSVELPFVSRSSLYFLIWKAMHPQLYRGINQLEQRYLESIGADLVLEQEQMQEDSWRRKIDIWRKYTRLQHQVA